MSTKCLPTVTERITAQFYKPAEKQPNLSVPVLKKLGHAFRLCFRPYGNCKCNLRF